MTYRDSLHTLADHTASQVRAAYAAWEAGSLTDEEFVEIVAAFIEAANSRATALADLALAATLTVALSRPIPTLGLVPAATDRQRLTKAATTLLKALPDTPDPLARAERLGRSEPLTTAAQARGDAIARHPSVTGWTRSVSGSGCQLCTWWSRGGKVWPADHPMPTHKGCTCTQTPITKEGTAA